jgi:hypothetical protein
MPFNNRASTYLGAALSLAIIAGGSAAFAADADLPLKTPAPAAPPMWLVNQNTMSYSYVFDATDPFVGKTDKQVVSFTHFDVWTYGTNFFNIDLLKSDLRDPAAPCGFAGFQPTGCEGTTEIYGFFRSTLGWKQLFDLTFTGPLTNISFAFGADANSENNDVETSKRDYVAGLRYDFDLLFGATFGLSTLYYQEKSHFGLGGAPNPPFTPYPGTTYYRSDWRVEYLLNVPIGPKGTPLVFTSLAGINGPKGPGQGNAVTATEYFTVQKLTLDFGQVTWNKPNLVSVWVAYTYWQNKFGIPHETDPTGASTESSLALGITAAF